jgi:hypothetical protein
MIASILCRPRRRTKLLARDLRARYVPNVPDARAIHGGVRPVPEVTGAVGAADGEVVGENLAIETVERVEVTPVRLRGRIALL